MSHLESDRCTYIYWSQAYDHIMWHDTYQITQVVEINNGSFQDRGWILSDKSDNESKIYFTDPFREPSEDCPYQHEYDIID